MKKQKAVTRLSIGLNAREAKALEDAMRLYLHARSDAALATVSAGERNMMVRHALYAVCQAIVRQQVDFMPLAADIKLRTPNEAEQAEWLGSPKRETRSMRDNLLGQFNELGEKERIEFIDEIELILTLMQGAILSGKDHQAWPPEQRFRCSLN